MILARANVFRHHVELCRRDIQTVRPGIADFDIVLHRAIHRHLYDARKPADTVIFMHHKIAHGEIGIGPDLLTVGHGLVFRPAQAACSDLRIGKHRKLRLRVLHAGGETPRRNQACTRRGHRIRVLHGLYLYAAACEKIPQKLRAPEITGKHDDAEAQREIMRNVVRRCLQAAAIGRELLDRDPADGARLKRVTPHRETVRHENRPIRQTAQHVAP